jgi:hypothetical protein
VNIYWLFLATLFCAFIGYRLAVHYRMSGLTGLTIALSLCITFGTSLWRSIVVWAMIGDHLVTAGATVLTAATLFAFVEKYKFLAIVKITTMLFPVSLASISLPQFAASWNSHRSAGPNLSWIQTLGSRDRPQPQSVTNSLTIPLEEEGVESAPVEPEQRFFAKVATKSLLYESGEEGLVRSATMVKPGTWVLASRETVNVVGKRWVEVMLPTTRGEYRDGRSAIGFIPVSHISSRIPLPSD